MSGYMRIQFYIQLRTVYVYSLVVHYALSFLVSWAHSCEEVRPVLCGSDKFASWLKRLTLEAPEVSTVRELKLTSLFIRYFIIAIAEKL